MEYRSGKCSQCGAEYQVPASFAHNVARCKQCRGVVHLSAPGGKRGDSAPRAAASSATPPAASSPAPEPGRPSTPPRTEERPRPTAEPAAPAPRPVRPSEAPRRARPEPAPAAERAAEPAPAPRKGMPAPVLAAGIGVLVLVLLLFLFRDKLFAQDSAPRAPTGAESAPADASRPVAPEPGSTAPGRESAPPSEPEPARESGPGGQTGALPSGSAATRRVALASFPDLGPTPDTSAAEWDQLNEWAAQWLDVDAGAAGERAQQELVQQKRKAVPVILNALKKQDFATPAGRDAGERCTAALTEICNGATSFTSQGRSLGAAEDVEHCADIVRQWLEVWQRSEHDIGAWIDLAHLEEADPAEASRLRERFGGFVPTAEGDEDE